MLKTLFVLSTALCLSTTFAKGKKTAATAETLKVDTAASSITWQGFKKVGAHHIGKINIKSGQIEMKAGKIIGGEFVIDMASITNEDLKNNPEYHTKLLTHLKSADFFDVAKYPTAEFKITSVHEKAGKTWINGKLTLKDKTEALDFPATIESKGGVVTGKAKIEVDRTKWGVIYGSGNFIKELTADKIINDKFELDLDLVAKK